VTLLDRDLVVFFVRRSATAFMILCQFRLYASTLLVAFAWFAGPPGRRISAQTIAPGGSPETVEQHLAKGYDALKEDQYEAAEQEFRAALAIDPKLVLRARFPLAVALFESHKFEEARREFEAVGRDNPNHPNVFYYIGRLDLEAGAFSSAIRNLTKAVQNPPFRDAAYYLGFAYFKQGDLAAAEKWLSQAVQENPYDARVQYQLALVYRKQRREDEARKTLASSEKLRDREADQGKLRVECAQKLEHAPSEEAHALCEKLDDPDDATNLTALGTIYAQRGELQAALQPLRRAAELEPQSPQMQYNLALAYYQLHDFEHARPPLEAAIKRWPDLFQLSTLYGAVLFELHEDTSAYEELLHAHNLKPEDPGTEGLLYLATLRVAQQYQNHRRPTDAIRYYEKAAKLRPIEAEPHRALAEIYSLTGHPAQSATEHKQAVKLEKNAEQRR